MYCSYGNTVSYSHEWNNKYNQKRLSNQWPPIPPFPIGDMDPYLIHRSLDRPHSLPQTTARLAHALLHNYATNCRWLRYSNTTVYCGIHECSECIPVDSGVTNLIHDRRSCVDFVLEVEANVARCVHSSVNKPGVKCNSGLWDVYPLQTLLWR